MQKSSLLMVLLSLSLGMPQLSLAALAAQRNQVKTILNKLSEEIKAASTDANSMANKIISSFSESKITQTTPLLFVSNKYISTKTEDKDRKRLMDIINALLVRQQSPTDFAPLTKLEKDGSYTSYLRQASSLTQMMFWSDDPDKQKQSSVINLLKEFSKHNPDVNLHDGNGCTALFWATTRCNIECVKELLIMGADPKIRNTEFSEKIQDEPIELLRKSLTPTPFSKKIQYWIDPGYWWYRNFSPRRKIEDPVLKNKTMLAMMEATISQENRSSNTNEAVRNTFRNTLENVIKTAQKDYAKELAENTKQKKDLIKKSFGILAATSILYKMNADKWLFSLTKRGLNFIMKNIAIATPAVITA